MMSSLTDEELRVTLEACEGKTREESAKILGIALRTLRYRLAMAARRGLSGTKPVMDGFEISKVSTQQDEAGVVTKTFITQKPERGPEFTPPDGHKVRGFSALVDGEGRIIQQWIKTVNASQVAITEKAIKAAFESYTGQAGIAPGPGNTNLDLATVYIVGDQHLGMYAWKDEAGIDYDLDIGRDLLMSTATTLMQSTPASHTAVILSLGDFFHADTSENRTTKGTPVDVDTRRFKICQIGVEVLINVVRKALSKHEQVIVRCLPGNHDYDTSPWLTLSLNLFFSTDLRVTVDCDQSAFWFWQFGRVYLAATHGDRCKVRDLPMVMASWHKEKWGSAEYRYGYAGHVHHKSKFCDEVGGVVCETFQVLCPADAWHATMGYRAGRSMVAITHHRERGEILRNTVNISPGRR